MGPRGFFSVLHAVKLKFPESIPLSESPGHRVFPYDHNFGTGFEILTRNSVYVIYGLEPAAENGCVGSPGQMTLEWLVGERAGNS